jgi:predicted AAA+ superfamily ATPase
MALHLNVPFNTGQDSAVLWHDPNWSANYAHKFYNLPAKERLILNDLRNFIESDTEHSVMLISGIRQIGKTVALKHLWASIPDAVYIDLSADSIDIEVIEQVFLDKPTSVLLLDEVVYLDNYEQVMQRIFNASRTYGFKVVMTGSSPAHLTKLSTSKLGGRARFLRLTPIMFVEYLYMTGRIKSYSEYQTVTNDDFADYLLLKGLNDLRIQFDTGYFNAFYREVEMGNSQRYMNQSFIDLRENDLLDMCNLIAYKLSTDASYDKAVGHKLKIGGAEYNSLNALQNIKTPRFGKINLSDAFVTESHKGVRNITTEDKVRILYFLLWSGIANLELIKSSDNTILPQVSEIMENLKQCKKPEELIELFNKVSICLTSPLFYTRLGSDIVSKMEVDIENLCRGDMLGRMLEVYVRGAVTRYSFKSVMHSVKLKYEADGLGEVDIYEANKDLLLEVTTANKSKNNIHLTSYFTNLPLIRICTTRDINNFNNNFHRIPYSKLCCMLDTGDVFELDKTVV